ncbi:MAG: hypothetical protein QGI09_08445, partial [Dehalococcoidia bacterium]|nr:hypothetical protein [Dehalococcoidia bacterium]
FRRSTQLSQDYGDLWAKNAPNLFKTKEFDLWKSIATAAEIANPFSSPHASAQLSQAYGDLWAKANAPLQSSAAVLDDLQRAFFAEAGLTALLSTPVGKTAASTGQEVERRFPGWGRTAEQQAQVRPESAEAFRGIFTTDPRETVAALSGEHRKRPPSEQWASLLAFDPFALLGIPGKGVRGAAGLGKGARSASGASGVIEAARGTGFVPPEIAAARAVPEVRPLAPPPKPAPPPRAGATVGPNVKPEVLPTRPEIDRFLGEFAIATENIRIPHVVRDLHFAFADGKRLPLDAARYNELKTFLQDFGVSPIRDMNIGRHEIIAGQRQFILGRYDHPIWNEAVYITYDGATDTFSAQIGLGQLVRSRSALARATTVEEIEAFQGVYGDVWADHLLTRVMPKGRSVEGVPEFSETALTTPPPTPNAAGSLLPTPSPRPASGRPRTLLDMNREARGMAALTPEQRAAAMDIAKPL